METLDNPEKRAFSELSIVSELKLTKNVIAVQLTIDEI